MIHSAFLALATVAGLVFATPSAYAQIPSFPISVAKPKPIELDTRPRNYGLQPGDMVFFNDHKWHWVWLYKMVGSDAPYHAALVFRKPNGESALVEAGPNDTLYCRITEIEPRFRDFPGDVTVRRLKTPLSPAASDALTQWSLERDGKKYAIWRLLLQGTPVCCRAPLRKELFGKTYLNRNRYLCAELVVAGGTIAGIFDPNVHKANTIYPRDIVADDIYDLSHLYHPAEAIIPYETTVPQGKCPPRH